MILGEMKQNGTIITKMNISPGEVWLVKFPLEEDKSQYLKRPVIVLDVETMEVLSVKVTTTPPGENDPYDTPILYWEYAKLRMKSTARVSKTILVDKSQFIHIIGDLHHEDFENVQQQFMMYINKSG